MPVGAIKSAVRVRLLLADPPAGTEILSLPEAGVLTDTPANWYSSQEGAPSTARFTEELPPAVENRLTETDAEFSSSSVATVTDWGVISRVKVVPAPRTWKSFSAKSPVVDTLASIR